MKFEIKKRFSGELFFSIETDTWRLAIEAALKANADLSYADLSNADLNYANLRNTDLSYADLSNAMGINKYLCTPLMVLHDQIGPIRAYKLVNKDGEGPFNGGIMYEIGMEYGADNANTNEAEHCARGINLATLDWCMREWQPEFRIFVAEFTSTDIAAIPIATDGKFRVHRCKIVGEKDLYEIGLLKDEKRERKEK